MKILLFITQNYNMIIDEDILKKLELYIKMQNIELLKLIANEEKWNYKELLQKYIEK